MKRKFVEEYVYKSTEGLILYKKKRFALYGDDEVVSGKTFVFERLEDGEWKTGLGGIERVLFNLENRDRLVLELGRPTVVCEGEKAQIALQKLLGDSAWVTAVGGAEAWLPEFAELLKDDPQIIFVPDFDSAGEKLLTKALQDLAAKGRKR